MPSPYPREFRERVLARLAEPGATVKQVSREFGINHNSVTNWRKQATVGAGEQPGLTTDEKAELTRLRREVRRLKEERDILKKAAAFFATEDARRS